MKTESGNDFIIVANAVVEEAPERVSEDWDDDKPIACIVKRRKEVYVDEKSKKKRKIKKSNSGEPSLSVTKSVSNLVAGMPDCFNKKKRLTRKRKGGRIDKEEGRLSKGIKICEPRNEVIGLFENEKEQEQDQEEQEDTQQEEFVEETEEEKKRRMIEFEENWNIYKFGWCAKFRPDQNTTPKPIKTIEGIPLEALQALKALKKPVKARKFIANNHLS